MSKLTYMHQSLPNSLPQPCGNPSFEKTLPIENGLLSDRRNPQLSFTHSTTPGQMSWSTSYSNLQYMHSVLPSSLLQQRATLRFLGMVALLFTAMFFGSLQTAHAQSAAYSNAGLPAPTVTSDKDDYAPGEVAIISGTGWKLDTKVDVHFEETPAYHAEHQHDFHDITVDANGNWQLRYQIEDRHLGVAFKVHTVGKQTGSEVYAYFTDDVTLSVGGSTSLPVSLSISADKASDATTPAYTLIGNLTNGSVRISEKTGTSHARSFSTSLTQFVLTAPSGWEFQQSSVAASRTPTTAGSDITGFGTITYSSTTITIPVTVASTNTNDVITISNVYIRPVKGSTISNSGIVTLSFNGTIDGATSPSDLVSLTQTVGVATKLGFTTEPSNVLVGQSITPAMVVQIQDQFGNKVPASGRSISIAASRPSGTVTFNGTSPRTTDATGKAIFDNISFAAANTNVKFTATVSGTPAFTSAVSSTFDITSPCTAPTIPTSGNPTDQGINYGANATFTVSTTGTTPTSYSWEVKTTPTGDWAPVNTNTGSIYSISATTGALTITKPTVAMTNYLYRVIANGCSPEVPSTPSGQAKLTVNKLRLTVENPALTTTKTYDGLTAAQVTAGAITNKVGSEAVTVSAAANYDTKDQGSNKPITVAYTLGGGAMDNYLAPVDYVVNNGVIERRRLTVENPALTTTKTYDGLTAAQVTAGAITNKVGSEAVTVSAAANYDTKDQGSNKPITVAYTLGGGAMDNYLAPVDYVVNNGVIERRRLTVENPALTTTKTYDGLTAAQVTAGAITNKVGSEAVTVSAAANYDTKDQGSNKPITVAYTLGGGAMDNYLAPVDYVVNNGVIERRRLTVENPALTTTKTYDGLTAAQVTAGAITNKVGSEAVTVSAAANYDTKDQGSNKPITVAYTLGGGAMDNYLAPVDYVVNNGVIERRRLTVENPALTTTKTYDGLTAAQVTAGAITNKVGSEAVTVSAAANYDTKDQGSNKPITVAYTLGGGAMDNYLAPVDYVVNNGVIERRRLTVENPALTTTKTYDGLTAAQVTAGAITNKVGSEAVTVSAAANYDTKDQGSNKPITVAYTLGGGAMDNYLAPVDYVVNNGVIERRRLTVENPALTTTKTYDGLTAAQVTAGAITNKVGSEAVTVSAAANYDTKDQGSNKPITVAYTLGGGAMDNYLAPVDYVVNNGVIERRRLTVENPALTTTKTYDGLTAAQVTAGAITNKVGSEAVTVSAAANYDTKDQGSNKPITVAYTLGGGAMDNYLAPVDYVVNNGVIEKRAIIVTASANTKAYDGNTSSVAKPTITTGSLANGDVAVFSQLYDTKHVGTGKTMLPSLVSINDASAKTMVNNYQVTLVNSTNGVITAIGLVVKANNVGSQYSDIPSFGYTITGFVNGDDESNSVSGAPSYSSTAFGSNFAITSGPGTYSVMPTIGTLSSNNYTFSFQAGSLTVTAEDAIASYNGQTVFGAQLQNKSYTSNISLSALVNDVDDRSAIGGLRGDVRKAKVNFTLEGNNTFGNTSLSNVEVGLLDPNNSTMGQAVKNNIPVTLTTSEVSSGGKVIEVNNLVGRQLSLAGSVNGYYTSGIALPLPSVITIVVAGSDNVNGGGFIKLPATTNGSYKGSEGSRMNFGLTMKWNKSGANLQGTTNFIYRTTHGKLYQIKSNAINSLNTVTNTTTNESTATINTKAEFRELNADGTIKWFLGNMDLTVVAVQSLNDNTGKSDKISVRLVNPSTRPNSLNVSIPAGLVFTNDMLANGNSALTTLGGGKLNVRNASTTISTTTVSAPIATRTAEMTEQMIVPNKLTASAFPNPAITHFNIKLTSNNTRDAITLRVFNQLGQIVDVKRGLTSGQVIQVGSGYKQGTYYVEVMQGEQKQSLQVVKTN
jgi:hypothetical protein